MEEKVVITSYEVVRMEASLLEKREWFYIVVDEGHRLKNNECQLMQCLFTFAHNPNTSRLSRLVPHRTTSKSYGP